MKNNDVSHTRLEGNNPTFGCDFGWQVNKV